MLDVESSDLGWGWETINLVVDDGVHESGFTGTVSATETVSVSSLEPHVGVVQQDLGTIGQVELLNVTEVLTLLLVGELDVVGLLLVSLLLQELSDSWQRVVGGKSELDVLGDGSLPSLLVEVVGVNERSTENTSVGETWVALLDSGAAVLLDEGNEVGSEVGSLGDLEWWEVGTVRSGWHFTNSSQSGDSSVGDGSGLWVTNGLGGLDQSGEQLRQERSDSVLRVDEFRHVVGNDGNLSLGGSWSLIKTSDEQRSDEGDCWGSNLGNECGGGKDGDGLGDLFDWVKERLDQSGDELLDILVLDQTTGSLESYLGGLLDIGLGVPDGSGEDWDNVGHCSANLSWGRGDELLEDVETSGLDLPFSGSLDLLKDRWKDDESSPWVHGLDNGLDGGKSRILDRGDLVGKSLEENWEWRRLGVRDDVWLEEWGGTVLAEGGDGGAGGLSGRGVLLVVEGLKTR